MADATITGSLLDAIGDAYDFRGAKIWLIFNTANKRVTAADGTIRTGAGAATVNADGTFSLAGVPVPSAGSNPVSFQVMVCYEVPPRLPYQRKVTRERGNFGWMTVTTSADIKDLEAEQYAPPEYLTVLTEQLDEKIAEAEEERQGAEDARDLAEQYRDEAHDISGIDTSDDVVELLIKPGVPGPKTKAALSASIAHEVTTPGTSTRDGLLNTFGAVFTPEQFGTCPGDGTDVSTYLLAAVAAAQAVGGGTVLLQPGKNYRMTSALAIPYTGTTTPLAKPVRITSRSAASSNGRWPANAKNGGATLDLRYAGAGGTSPAKIDCRGAGLLEIDHLNILSGGSDDFPIFQTTNTTAHIHHCFIQGNTAKSGSSCVQDAIIFGGTSITVDNTDDAPFQGYGSRVHDNFFDHIRRGFVGQSYCNSVPVENNTFSTSCGNDGTTGTTTLGGAIEFTGNATAGNTVGCATRGNTIECVHYKYGVAVDYAANCTVGPDGYWDPSGPYVAGVFVGPNAVYNHVMDGYHNQNYPLVLDKGLTTTVRTAAQSRASFYPQAKVQRGSSAVVTTGGIGWAVMHPSGDQSYQKTNAGAAASPSYPEAVLGTSTATLITDLATTSGSNIVTSATANWTRQHQYMPIGATGIPAGTLITRWISASSVELSANATATATGVTARFGLIGGGSSADEIGFARRHIQSKGAIGSAAPNANAGLGATAAATGTDTAFTLTLVTGSSAMAVGNLCSVGAGISWGAAAKVVLTPKNAAAANAIANNDIYCTNTTSNFFLACGVALPTGTTLVFDVHMIQ